MSKISNTAAQAREHARRPDGKFGEQHLGEVFFAPGGLEVRESRRSLNDWSVGREFTTERATDGQREQISFYVEARDADSERMLNAERATRAVAAGRRIEYRAMRQDCSIGADGAERREVDGYFISTWCATVDEAEREAQQWADEVTDDDFDSEARAKRLMDADWDIAPPPF